MTKVLIGKAVLKFGRRIHGDGRDHLTQANDQKVLKELQKSNNIFLSLLEHADKRLRIVEEEISKASTSISSSDTTPRRCRKSARAKADVPQALRVSSIIISSYV